MGVGTECRVQGGGRVHNDGGGARVETLHIGEEARVVQGLLARWKIAMLPKFRGSVLPMYPRSFDALIMGCGMGVSGK